VCKYKSLNKKEETLKGNGVELRPGEFRIRWGGEMEGKREEKGNW